MYAGGLGGIGMGLGPGGQPINANRLSTGGSMGSGGQSSGHSHICHEKSPKEFCVLISVKLLCTDCRKLHGYRFSDAFPNFKDIL